EASTPDGGSPPANAKRMTTETESSAPKWPDDLPGEQDQRASQKPESLGPVLLQPPPWWRRSSPSPPSQEERVGERRSTLLNAPLPNPLPTRSSRGEGENYWWGYRDAPDSLSLTPAELPSGVKTFSVERA